MKRDVADDEQCPLDLAKTHASPNRQKALRQRGWRLAALLSISGVILLSSRPGQGLLARMSNLWAQNTASSRPTPTLSKVLPVDTQPLEAVHSYNVLRTYTGTLKAQRRSELGFERSGTLHQIVVDEGQWVAAGTPLAYLDTADLQLQKRELLAQRAQASIQLNEMQAGPRLETIAAAQAAVRELQAQLSLVRIKQTRRAVLYREGAISREQLDEVSFSASTLQARFDQAQSQLNELLAGTRDQQLQAQQAQVAQFDAKLARIDLEIRKGTLKAPFNGTIASRQADEGIIVTNGQPILSLVENGSMEAHIGVPTAVAERLQPASRHAVQVEGRSYPAKVVSILPDLNAKTQTQTIVLTLASAAAQTVSPGQTARLTVGKSLSVDGYWLPNTALVQGEQGVWSCYILSEPQDLSQRNNRPVYQVKRQILEIIHTESARLLVKGDLRSGDLVIVTGTHRMVPGQWVRPR